MVLPIIIGGLLAGGGWLAGKSGGGGAVELFTKKTATQTTTSIQNTSSSVYAPTINRTYDVQYNIASGGSSISTKKESNVAPSSGAVAQPQLISVPQTSQGGGIGGGSSGGVDFMTLAIYGALGLGAYKLLKGKKK